MNVFYTCTYRTFVLGNVLIFLQGSDEGVDVTSSHVTDQDVSYRFTDVALILPELQSV